MSDNPLRRHGGIASKETLSGDMDFFTVHTVAALEEGAYGAVNSATRNLIRLIETIALGAQPVLVSVSEEEVDLTVAGNRTLFGLGTNFNQDETTVYTLKFAVEHTGALGTVATADDVSVARSLAARLDGLELPFETAGVPAQGGAVAISTLDADGAATKNVTIKAFAVL
jgi:hypothetical protein